MIKAYTKKITTIRTDTNTIYCENTDFALKDKSNFEKKEIQLTWDNLSDIYIKYRLLPFGVWNSKKGRIISWWHENSKNPDIKERKTKDIPIKIIIEDIELRPSEYTINDIITYHNGEMAMKFLREQGIKI